MDLTDLATELRKLKPEQIDRLLQVARGESIGDRGQIFGDKLIPILEKAKTVHDESTAAARAAHDPTKGDFGPPEFDVQKACWRAWLERPDLLRAFVLEG